MLPPESGEAQPPPLTLAFRSVGMLLFEGMSVGLFGWTVQMVPDLDKYVVSNALAPESRKYLMADMAFGALVPVLAAIAVLVRKREQGLDLVYRVSHRASPFMLAGIVPLFFRWQLWSPGRELTFLALVAGFGLALQALMRISLSTPPIFGDAGRAFLHQRLEPLRRSITRWPPLPFALVLVASTAYAFYFSKLTIENHYLLGTSGHDLGIENNLIWNAVHFTGPLFKTSVLAGPLSSHLGYHQTYIAYVLGIPYRIWPRPEMLLAIQATLIGATAIPLYLFARRHIGEWAACLVAVLCLAYAPFQGSNLYDFHYLPFAPFFLLLCLWLLEGRRDRWAAVAIVLTLATREDFSALLALVGVYLVLTGERPRAGLIVALIGGVYFVTLKFIVMPRFLAGESAYIHQYAELLPEGDRGFGGVLKTVFGNPGYTMTSLLEGQKLVYLLQIMTPLVFVPWRRPIGLLCTMPGFFFTLLATKYPALNSIAFQYTAYWTSFLFIAMIANLAWLKRREKSQPGSPPSFRAWLVAISAATLVTSYQFGAVFHHELLSCGFVPFRSGIKSADRDRHRDLYELIAKVPPRAKIAASEMLAAHVSSRPDAYTLKVGFFDAEFLLVWMTPGGLERDLVVGALQAGTFGVVMRKGEFVLAQRGHPTDENAGVLASIH
ncbi:MAG TPA: DUF2079 domain-containing protein [Polyangiaceae bacterium]|nr:DUF2079 domain-containing protein [Polyangiaceae bacterium]